MIASPISSLQEQREKKSKIKTLFTTLIIYGDFFDNSPSSILAQ